MKYLLPILIIMVGCAYPKRTTKYSQQTPSSGKAIIYLYRTPTSLDSANPDVPKFYINDIALGKLEIGGYYAQEVEPGEIDVSYHGSLFGIPIPWPSHHVQFVAVSGQKYFVKFSVETLFRITDFRQVSGKQGEEEIQSTVLLVN